MPGHCKSDAELEESAPRPSEGRMASGRGLPTVGFIVTNLARSAERLVDFYNQRDMVEQWIKEGRVRSNGRARRAAPSPPMLSASSSMHWLPRQLHADGSPT